ncbi:54S ribosomal protein L20, mitochondrial [Fulvia fulva]|uniref:54S ribosomal protein L20, mitochondrial n=1 Tax=Passalora fulva TaxID=5499 RepID=A0A9Q8PIH1_PASFU|nr:54S ribosomal protein L20, mitochondrial [Fulvia fulva]KAK4626688.1 54S ribosomal protein L20, mitochondrial [Fulvia fulva]KAK4628450.1 54S ribosomal protein L20, mitochondrial [Fulvia fulva]UJO23027.1 54S ribosomal protein L20, mitochondrial [Fulvia fulva]WPV13149.1 54S ribosomal protein L20, mitochondrial [Fulvia fulva]WPV29293.1 54S ribosomal protein L20, mitochondrial [Fulvia fulva]
MASALFAHQLRPTIIQSEAAAFVCKSCRRNVATARRTRKALRVKLDPSFAPSKTEAQDHIIFNPPSSAPNVYHTPAKFLPKSDPRRALHTTSAPTEESAPAPRQGILASIAAQRAAAAPPVESLKPVRPIQEKKYHLTQAEIDEIRRLRAEDPRQWTRVRLAEKFDCSQFFVSLCCSAPEIKQEQDQELERIKAKWGRRKRDDRDARQERKKRWGMDA